MSSWRRKQTSFGCANTQNPGGKSEWKTMSFMYSMYSISPCYLYMLPKVKSMFGFWNSIPGRKFFLAGWTRNGVSMIYMHTHTNTHEYSLAQSHSYVTLSRSDKTLSNINTERRVKIRRWRGRLCIRYLEQLSVRQRFTHQLLHVATNNKQGGHDAHQHPSKDKREAHPTERERETECGKHNHTETSVTSYCFLPSIIFYNLFASCLPLFLQYN